MQVPTLCVKPPWTPSQEKVSSSDILLISSLRVSARDFFFTPAEMHGRSCHLPVNQKFSTYQRLLCPCPVFCGGPAGATWHAHSLQTTFSQPPLFRLLYSGPSFQGNQTFPGFSGLSWDQEYCLMYGTGHDAACNRQLLIRRMCIQFFVYISQNYHHDGAAWFLFDWNNNEGQLVLANLHKHKSNRYQNLIKCIPVS